MAITLIIIFHYCCDKSQPGGSMCYPPLQHHSPHLQTKQNVLRFATFRDQIRRYLAEPFTHNMHTTSLIIPDLLPVVSFSSITSFSTPVAKAEWAKICDLYLGNELAVWLQISHGRQPSMAIWLCKTLPRQLKALSLSIASFSTPVEEAKLIMIYAL